MIEIIRDHAHRVKHWSSGDMALCWTAARMTAAQAQFRRVKGYRQLPALDVCGIYFFESKKALAAFRESELARTIPTALKRSMSAAKSTTCSTHCGPNGGPFTDFDRAAVTP